MDGDFSTIQEKHQKAEQELLNLHNLNKQLEKELQQTTNEMQKFQYEYEDQLAIWKKEKGDMQTRIQELMANHDKIRYDNHEQLEVYK